MSAESHPNEYAILPGTRRTHRPGSEVLGRSDPHEWSEITGQATPTKLAAYAESNAIEERSSAMYRMTSAMFLATIAGVSTASASCHDFKDTSGISRRLCGH
jgi:hypothetical protein